ncbi:MAG: 2-phosphosulfolactate phosphatase [Planctomycetaceae bacterium]|jgi:2-phosphosulfolactate phosphatase|nr:2-phosphosulfolactate phosphatase [Planctomycetaceae bacterium]
MPPNINVHLLPALFSPKEVLGGTAVIIDILRASTTICHALDAGASQVIPCLTVEEAREISTVGSAVRTKFNLDANEQLLLGGERGGVKIDRFDLTNTPTEYTSERVSGKTVLFTTTNGTKALHHAAQAEEVVIGAFVNLSAVVTCLENQNRPIHLVCAGTNGAISGEDVLFAGAVVARLLEKQPNLELKNDSTRLALDFWRSNSQNEAVFRQAMLDSQGGRNLQKLGLTADIERAGDRDLFDFVPTWNKQTNAISQ